MSRTGFRRLEALFRRAVWPVVGRRAAGLDTTVGYDPEVAARVQALVHAERHAAATVGGAIGAELSELDAIFDLPAIGDVLGSWRLATLLETSGSSRLYRAVHLSDQRSAAIKVAAVLQSGPVRRALVDAERRSLARLDHPGVVRLVDDGGAGCHVPCLILELLDGAPLQAQARTLGLRARLERCAELCDILACVHDRGVVHADIKPANLRITSAGALKLLDFGSAVLVDDRADPGSVAWAEARARASFTPAYASPEQIRREPIGPWTDVHGAGAVLYELLVGRPPHGDRRDLASMLRAICDVAPAPPSHASTLTFCGAITPALDRVVLRALHRAPARRHPSMRSLAAALRRVMPPWSGDPATGATNPS